jgi:hypothetical protein
MKLIAISKGIYNKGEAFEFALHQRRTTPDVMLVAEEVPNGVNRVRTMFTVVRPQRKADWFLTDWMVEADEKQLMQIEG